MDSCRTHLCTGLKKTWKACWEHTHTAETSSWWTAQMGCQQACAALLSSMQHAADTTRTVGSWARGAWCLLMAEGKRQQIWQRDQWHLVIKPFAADVDTSPRGLAALQSQHDHDARGVLRRWFNTRSLLAHAGVPMYNLRTYGRLCPQLACLHASLDPLGENRFGPGVFQGLKELYLHALGGRPGRIRDVDLQLWQLQHLQLSGNLTMDISPDGLQLQTSKLMSLTLQQTLRATAATSVLDSQPQLQYLTLLVPEPQSQTPLQIRAARCASGVRSVEALQDFLVPPMEVAFADDPDLLWEHLLGAEPANVAAAALDYVLTPPGCLCPADGGPNAGCAPRSPLQRTCCHCAGTRQSSRQHIAMAATHMQHTCRADSAAEHLAASSSGRRRALHPLQKLTVHTGWWVDLQPLLQLCSPQQLLVCALPAITDRSADRVTGQSYLDLCWFDISAAFFAGAIPSALRIQLPVGLSLRVLTVDTSRTGAGVEVDDQTLMAISTSCKQLQVLELRALLQFGADGVSALRSLPCLQQLLLWDLRWQSVQFLMQQAADVPADVMPELRHEMLRLLLQTYLCCAALRCVILPELRGHRLLRAAASVGMAAFELPVTAACAIKSTPLQVWQAARLCAAAARRAGRPPFVLRPCWLPPSLQRLQLHDCVLRCRRRCPACNSSGALQGTRQLQVEQLSLQHDATDGAATLNSQAAFRRKYKSGRRSGLYPRLWGLVGKVLLAPAVPFAVTVAARAGLVWLLRGNGSNRHQTKAMSLEQLHAVMAAMGVGV